MTIEPGKRLGSYEILSPIGAGGMGEVYRARDTMLGRDVAIKVLPDAFARDTDRMARFGREAKLLAALDHTNIASIYGLEDAGNTRALVMQLAEGPTLAERILHGPLPIDDALQIAKQIADALEYAHEKGIIHRDLKPANVKVAPDDTVKILDFGLAKALEAEPSAAELANSPTISRIATQAGVLLGTAAYMSPEQAKGKPVDRRADIWAFGCVLYEMLTGRKAFGGETLTDTLAAVMRAEPDWSILPAATPTRVRVLLQRCLQKDPRQRLRDIGDARISLEDALSRAAEPFPTGAASVSVALWRWALPWTVAGAAVLAAVALALVHFGEKQPVSPRHVQRFEIAALDPRAAFVGALSPDGTRLVLGAPANNGPNRLWLRRMDSLETYPLEGTEGLNGVPFGSPDSRFVIFGTQDGKLKKIDTQGGPAQVLCDIGRAVLGGFWTSRGTIVFGDPTRLPGLWEVRAAGGVPAPLPGLKDAGNPYLGFPVLLPDEKHFLYSSGSGTIVDVYVGSLDSKAGQQSSKKVLAGIAPRFVYVSSQDDPNLGYLLYLRGPLPLGSVGTLLAQPFDLHRLGLVGEPVPVAEGVSASNFSASHTGTLVYGSGTMAAATGQLTLFDRTGKILGTAGGPGVYEAMAFSPDGNRVVAARNRNLWLMDLARGVSTRFTFDSKTDRSPTWSPDGSRIVFASNRDGPDKLYEKRSNGGGDAELLFQFDYGVVPISWSGDGRFLLFAGPSDVLGHSDAVVSVLPLDSDGHVAAKPFRFVQKGVGIEERFSPRSQGRPRWVAYSSDESGRYEVYVRPFDPSSPTGTPPGGGKWQVSTEGGVSPRWNANGKELFYVAPDRRVMSVDVSGGPVFQSGTPKPLFQPKGLAPHGSTYFNWDASSDGRKFIFATLQSASSPATPARFTVVLNWPSLLKK